MVRLFKKNMSEIDFLSILNDTNSEKNEDTGEITITVPKLETEDEYHITTSCKITSNCNTVITSKLFKIKSPKVFLSNIEFDSAVLVESVESVSFDNCTVKNPAQTFNGTFTISDSGDVSLSHVTIIESGKVPGLYVTRNSFVNATNLHVHDLEATLVLCNLGSFLTITDSVIHHTPFNGFHISGQSYIEIRKCQIHDTGYPAIIANSSQCIFVENEIKNVEQTGIAVESSQDFLIEKNKLSNITATGINASEKSSGIIKENEIFDIKGNGILISSSDVKVTENSIKNAGYPSIAVLGRSIATVTDNKIEGINLNGVCVRNAKDVTIENCEIKDVKEIGISVSDTENCIIKNNTIKNCKVAAIESYNNSKVFVNDNTMVNIGQFAFLVYTYGYMKAENNQISDVQNAMVNLLYKGSGDFVNNRFSNCQNQFESQTSSAFFFSGNGNFPAVTNDVKRANESVTLVDSFNDSNLLCLKCKKNKRDCYILDCGHKVFCKECAKNAKANKEACPLCRFPVKDISNLFAVSDDDICIICCDKKSDCLVLPCGHLGMCSSCLENWYSTKKCCPICRTEPSFYKKIINDM